MSPPVNDSTDLKSLPTHFHLGTGRAGSTFLFHLVKAHRELCLSNSQEIGFYSDYFDRGFEWYRSQFEGPGLQVDTSPAYFARGKPVADRIAKHIDGRAARFLLVLRNPIDYTYSHFLMRKNNRYFKRHREKYPRLPKTFDDLMSDYPEYLDRGKYFQNLTENWFEVFPESAFKVVLFRDLIKKPQETANEVLEFWGVESMTVETPEISKNATLKYLSLIHI